MFFSATFSVGPTETASILNLSTGVLRGSVTLPYVTILCKSQKALPAYLKLLPLDFVWTALQSHLEVNDAVWFTRQYDPFSAGIDFRRQNLTSIDVRF